MTTDLGDKPYTPGELTVHRDPATLHRITSALRRAGKRVALVPTMGALHAGHLELVRTAKASGNTVVIVSIFVNPLQFGANEDLDAYPRTFDADCELLRPLGVEVVFAPTAADMYPDGQRTMVHPGSAGAVLDGASRPTHFAGMLTVVLKLLTIVAPHAAYFGEKDYQQLVLIKQMVDDLNLDVDVVGVPTVRESDGLAMSSRNRYLDEEQRELATTLSAALVAGAHAAAGGRDAILAAAQSVLDANPEIEVDYLALTDRQLGEPPELGDGRLLVAARVGAARLIDNVGVAIGTGFAGRDPEQIHH
ncbi:pantoate--beta-alanine ligase [Gordonia sp. Z-3]|jgi:pantoate--beta-alanine ligase|uniref:Pantothenate synthetase n=1 Tax=Gordonia tangerina TaxID=2911060 RepID=A0ABS9DKJ8_9ACTN|nr:MULTISPECIES: pantoate--beta-alanine ligase [Gordonia]MAU80594.1 pantoate--beta-alanine ligase [Gordonia sp. (in: high G+C Gram-positive bacteria)]MCF3939762.1 pantoate--beta-alanine ligase [Gordonia tangerina]MED5802621.1 pantoate--beta-alanine ligase [Gordonia sp. Z-3]